MKLTPQLLAKWTLCLTLIASLIQCSDEELVPTENTITTNATTTQITSTTDPITCSSCTYIIPPNQHKIDGKALGIKPGDVICLNAATRYYNLTFDNIVGTSDKPVTVRNCGGTVTINTPDRNYVVRFLNSKYFRFTGGNVDNTYGIRLAGSTSLGLSLGTFSTNFEVDHIEIYNVGFAGIMAKTDPTCNSATVRGNFTMRNVSFHHNYIHDTKGEGFYIGHTSWDGVQTSCGKRLPHTIENVKIYENLVRNSGWDAIQLSSAPVGAQIYHNRVENYAVRNVTNQTSGICIGAGTGGVCHSNFIKGGYGPGIAVFGLADNTLHDNIIVNAGTMGIFCDERTAPGKGYRFINNTIVNPKADGIRIYAELVPMNLVINNIVVNPGNYATAGQNAYIRKMSSVKLDMSNNYFTRYIGDLKFVNASAFNYRLTSTSPAINKGRNISTFNIAQDFYKTNRLKSTAYDIGASEY